MQIGRRIYYDLATGNVIQDTGERQGSVIETTQDQDFAAYSALSQRVQSTVGVIQLAFGDLSTDFMSGNGYHVDLATKTIIFDTTPPVPVLDVVKQRKNDDIKTAADSNLTMFKSSALGTAHTYLSGMNDMLLLTGEYAFVKGSDYDNSAILWYTIENGNLSHTGPQFIKMYLDARLNVQTIKYRQATKEAQVGACTTTAQVATIAWPNPNPPTVPIGLAGTAGAAGSGQVTLNWTANTDVTMIGGGSYNIYVDGVKANAALLTSATYTVTALAVGAHTFAITAVDTDGLESAQCASVSVTTT